MSISDSSTFASKPFTFIVESKPLYIHAALVAAHSEPLNRMINGHLSEARQGFAVLDDVDEGTFLRFVRWTYSNDYPAQEHRSVDPFEDPAPTKDTTTAGPNTRISSSGRIVKKKKKKTKPAVMGYLRESFIYSQLDVEPFSYIVPAARANEGPDEDYIPVFLGHARVYVFAEKYDIQDLKLLALQKLQHQLAIHTLYIERVCEIMSLLKYVYANTSDRSDDLRSMLAHYVGVELANLVRDGQIKNLMLEHEDMLNDFLKMCATRVN